MCVVYVLILNSVFVVGSYGWFVGGVGDKVMVVVLFEKVVVLVLDIFVYCV